MGGPLGSLLCAILISAFCGQSRAVSFAFSSSEALLNCSSLCKCESENIQYVLNQHLQRHRNFMGTEFRDDVEYSSTYIDFIGIYVLMVNQMVEIKCLVNDERQYAMSTLLNGVDNLRYVSLEVSCRHGEEILWDVATWQVSVNIFVGKNCKIIPLDYKKGVIIPMNMWIFEAENCGVNLLSQINIRYTMSTIVLAVTDTDSQEIPDSWRGDYMLSATTISLQANNLKDYSCQLIFTKDIDTVNLERNKLTTFPKCILYEQITGIRFLSLARNNVSDISHLFEDKAASSIIQIIDLSHNLISKIGTFKTLRKLSVLDLSSNLITEINDDAFQNLVDLQKLLLQDNRIHYIGSVAFRNNVNLIHLNLNTNGLKFVRLEQFPRPDKELTLDVRRNKLHFPPFASCAEKEMIDINIKVFSAANPYRCNCDMIRMEECINHLNELNSSNAYDVYNDIDLLKCASPRENKGILLHQLSFVKSCVLENNCPQSCSCHLRHKSIIDVNCTARRLLELPDTIPSYPNSKSRLYLSHNPLQLLSYRSYLANLSELHVDNCLLTSVTPSAIAALQNVNILALHNNLLQRLPSNTKNITLRSASNVTLHNNRWTCSCDNLWLPSWIVKHRHVLWTPGNIVCNYLQKPVEEFSKSDVSCTSYSKVEVAVAMALALVSIASTVYLMFHYKDEISLVLYSKLGIRLGLNLSYGDRYNPYDVYVSYGEDNYKWVVDTLAPRLEDGPKKYKLCLHYRDFPADMSVIENIPWAIQMSRCSILVLSKAFVKKEWNVMDLRTVFQRLLLVANRLILIVTDDLTPDDVSPDLRAYMSTHEYLQVQDPQFWEKLDMFLPPKSIADEEIDNAQEAFSLGSGDAVIKADGTLADEMSEMFNTEHETGYTPYKKSDCYSN